MNILLFSLLAFAGWASVNAENCTDAFLHFRLGALPSETSYRLVCDRKTVWSAHQLKLPVNLGNLVHTETKCLRDAEECNLYVYNTARALSKKNHLRTTYTPPGIFELIVDKKEVFHYDGSASFFKLKSDTFCVGQGCPTEKPIDECVETQLRLKLDEYPGEIGYRLQCEDDVLWYKPKWSHLVNGGWSFQVLNEEACVSKDSCCVFQVEDHWGDGLTSRLTNKPGSFTLKYDQRVVASYRGNVHGPFSKLEYKFGSCETIVCMDVNLVLKFDEFPFETGYSLTCGDNVVWDVPVRTFANAKQWAFETVTEKTCVSPSACCKFLVRDTKKNGLTSSQPGSFHLVYGNETVTKYDGSVEYQKLKYEFGSCL